MIEIPWGKFPLVDGQAHVHRWLQFYANIGRAQNTIVAYGRALDDHLRFLAEADTAPLVAGVDVVAAWIGDMLSRSNPRGAALVHLDSGAGLANASVQQRIVAVRSFYEFLVEDGLRERNPVRRGQSGRRGKRPRQGLVRWDVATPSGPTPNELGNSTAFIPLTALRASLREGPP